MKNTNKIFILKKHNGEYQNWHEITKSELKNWLKDGSIDEGDMIIYPQQIMNVIKYMTTKVKFKSREGK